MLPPWGAECKSENALLNLEGEWRKLSLSNPHLEDFMTSLGVSLPSSVVCCTSKLIWSPELSPDRHIKSIRSRQLPASPDAAP